jgi:hypothetical protein
LPWFPSDLAINVPNDQAALCWVPEVFIASRHIRCLWVRHHH